MKQLSIILLTLMAASGVLGQNINRPNKIGPMGVQVNTFTGNLFFTRNDIYARSRGTGLDITFNYNSYNYDQNIGFGTGWSMNYSMRCTADSIGNVTVTRGDGRQDVYTL